jgi:ABC-2 type transport system permease protein
VRTLASTGRVVWYALLSGANDYWAIWSARSWLFGLQLRMFSQISFFALIGKLLRSDQQTHFLLIGNAVMVAAMAATFAMNMTTAERANGTLPLLLASPSKPVVVFASRGLYLVLDGVLSALLGLFIAGPVFGIHLPWPRILLVVPLTLLVGLSAYCFSTFLAGLIIRYREITGLLVNATIVTLMALCGVNVPVSFYPHWLQWVTRCLPITNGLEAIRDLINGTAWTTIAAHAGAELLVASTWFTLALLTFGRFLAQGQRDGTLEYAS